MDICASYPPSSFLLLYNVYIPEMVLFNKNYFFLNSKPINSNKKIDFFNYRKTIIQNELTFKMEQNVCINQQIIVEMLNVQ